MRKRTILHTSEWAGTGGAETILLNLACHLDSNRFRSLALLPGDGWLRKKLEERGIPTFFAKSRAWYDGQLPRAMARLIRQEKIDLIHSTLEGQNFYSCVAGRMTACKTIVTYQGAYDFFQAREPRQAIKLWFVRHSAAAVVAVTDHIRQSLIDLGFPEHKTIRIYNCINTHRFQVPRDGRLRKELRCPAGTKLVGMVANLSKWKGPEFFVQAARKVVNAMPETRFVAVGEIDQAIEKQLLRLVEELSLENHFFFLGFREDVPEILADLDVFVLSSLSEGLPLSVLEAMAAARPVVVTRSGGPQEFVEDGRTGFLVPPGDADLLAARTLDLLRDPERAAAIGRDARARVCRDFTLEKMVRDYESLYEHLLG